jgi:UDP-N-acetylmuramoyl-L-alanyl-D-glutamate--2,6-diaminopimelate ligase
MLETILRKTQKMIPTDLYKTMQPIYHAGLAVVGTAINMYPSRKTHVIAITGTKGKSSTSEFMNAILENAGYKTALLSTIRFKIGEESRANMYKMTMPGRFFVQNFLRQAVDAKCDYAIVEMTSEGARFYRHLGVSIDTLLFTNLSPEHIDSHGSFEKYKSCKLRLAKAVEKSGKPIRTIVVNSDDKYATEFLNFKVDRKLKYNKADAEKIKLSVDGDFNKLNAAACKTFALSIGLDENKIDSALLNLKEISGRVQHINAGQSFDIIVDYAHTTDSLSKLYETYTDRYMIGVLGSCGGGRDIGKRAELGAVAEKYCDRIIITDEDPYDDNPREIMDNVASGIKNKTFEIIENRREAINHAIKTAQKYIDEKSEYNNMNASNKPKTPIVIISGKGTDPYIMRANGQKEKWSDAEVVREEVKNVLNK